MGDLRRGNGCPPDCCLAQLAFIISYSLPNFIILYIVLFRNIIHRSLLYFLTCTYLMVYPHTFLLYPPFLFYMYLSPVPYPHFLILYFILFPTFLVCISFYFPFLILYIIFCCILLSHLSFPSPFSYLIQQQTATAMSASD